MDMTLHADGKFAFTEKRHPDRILLTLDPSVTECSCSFWTAYLLQCPHLLLLKKSFGATICAHRWFQFSCLEKSTVDEQPHDHRDAASHSSVSSHGKNDEGITALEPNEDTRHRIDKWVAGENSKEIPQDAWHLVLVDMYFGTIPEQPFQYNIIEVIVLGHGGWQLFGYERACFPVHKVQCWMPLRCDQAKARVVSFAKSNGGCVGGGRSNLHLKTLE
jgi:hypothetical protein